MATNKIPDWIDVKPKQSKAPVKSVKKTTPVEGGGVRAINPATAGGSVRAVSQPARAITPSQPTPDLAQIRQQQPAQNTQGMPDWLNVQQRVGTTPTPIKRLDPLTATPEKPLVTIGQMPDNYKKPAVSDDEMMQNLLFKKAKKQSLTDDEMKFEIKYNMQKQKAQQAQQMQPQPTQNSQQSMGVQPQQMYGGQQPAFGIEDYMNATPEQQLQMQQSGFQQMSQMQQNLLNNQFQIGNQVMDDRLNRAQDRYDTTKSTMEQQNADMLNQFKADQQPQVDQSIEDIKEVGAENVQEIKTIESLRGFGRSSETARLLEKSGKSTLRQVADIESQANRAVNEYQVSLLDKMNTRLDTLQQRVDATQDQADSTKLEQVKAQSELMVDLFKQNPSSPQNMMATAEKLKQIQLQEQQQEAEQANEDRKFNFEVTKWSTEEQRAAQKQAQDVFQFAITNTGSGFLQNMDDQQIQNLAANIGYPPELLKNLGPTLKQQEMAYNQYNDQRDFAYKQQYDQENRALSIYQFQQGHQNDLEKMGLQTQLDITKEGYTQGLKDEKARGLYQSLGATGLPQNSQGQLTGGVTKNKGAISYQQPVKHPATGVPVIAVNPSLVNAYKPGTRKGSGQEMSGQCAYEARMMTGIQPLGNTISTKTAKLKEYISKGQGFMGWNGQPQPGDVVIFSGGYNFGGGSWSGHVAVVNASTTDGGAVLSEFNKTGQHEFSNSRKINKGDGKVIGFIRPSSLPKKYQVNVNAPAEAYAAAGKAGLQNVPKTGLGQLSDSELAAVQGPPQNVVQDPQALAQFVLQNGIKDLKGNAWWDNSPAKQQAWQLIQQSQQPQQQGFDFGGLMKQIPGMASTAGQAAMAVSPFGAAVGGLGAVGNSLMGMFGGGQQQQPQQSQVPQVQQAPQVQLPQQQSPQFQMPQQGQQSGMPQQQSFGNPMLDSIAAGNPSPLTPQQEMEFYQQDPQGFANYSQAKQAGMQAQSGQKFNDWKTQQDYSFGQDLQKNQSQQGNKDFTQVNQLANRFDVLSKEMRTLDNGMAVVNTFNLNTKNPYDDQALIFSFMKVLDPGSVVREGEFSTAQRNGSILSSIAANWGNAIQGTGMLTPDQRSKMIQTMRTLYSGKKSNYDQQFTKAQQVGQQFGIDPSLYLDYQPGQQNNNNDPLSLGFSSGGGGGGGDPLGLGI